MSKREKLAIIGSGPSTIYLLKHLLDEASVFKQRLGKIAIFEQSCITGMGMPYSPVTTDRYNMSNISSEELPALPVTFADWLRAQEPAVLQELDMEGVEITETDVYCRLALGQYLHSQYETLVSQLVEAGIPVEEHPGCLISDLRDHPHEQCVTLTTGDGEAHSFDQVVIATGHHWPEEDKTEHGYYASPWPIMKLLPAQGEFHNFAIGTLGASLSAFDVVSSLAHRHGRFTKESGELVFKAHPGAEEFKIIMHSSQGLLPHLQFDQVEPMREIYRHVSRDDLLALVDAKGFLRLENYYDKVCRRVLGRAFEKDEMPEMARLMDDPEFRLKDFVEKMTEKHDYRNAFKGMRKEMVEARQSVENHRPIHWKEMLDDLMYTLNFHAELMPAEDHIMLKSVVMPFVMNVIAAMPLQSADTILALYDAGKLDIVAGKVSIDEDKSEDGCTALTVEDEGRQSSVTYRMFIDCSGQKPLELEEYPFPSLFIDGSIRKARAKFANPDYAEKFVPEDKRKLLFQEDGQPVFPIGGVEIDRTYRLFDESGQPSSRIHDIAFPHITGLRPYSYGLQACDHTSGILVRALIDEPSRSTSIPGCASIASSDSAAEPHTA